MITDKRRRMFERVAAGRQEMTVILENVHDPHNIGAVIRTCDAVGIYEIFVLYTEDHLAFERLERIKSSSTGVRKWMQLHTFRDIDDCMAEVRKRYDLVLATHLDCEASSIYNSDLGRRIAFLFGNEHEGVSQKALQYADGNLLIPQMGMAQSLNISVACAVTLYEAMRQRDLKGMYQTAIAQDDILRKNILSYYLDKHLESYKPDK